MNIVRKIRLRVNYHRFRINRHKVLLPVNFSFKNTILKGEFIHIESAPMSINGTYFSKHSF